MVYNVMQIVFTVKINALKGKRYEKSFIRKSGNCDAVVSYHALGRYSDKLQQGK